MKKALVFAVLLGLAAAFPVLAKEVAGVSLPETTTVDGKTLKLNGTGLRTKMVFKVYVAGLYLETPSRDAAAIISSDQAKSILMSFLREVGGAKVTETIIEGFERNFKPQMGAFKARLDKLRAMIPDVVKGDEIVFTYVPGRGTVVTAKGKERGVIEGKDFADALFSVWLGGNPAQEDLKKALLGG
jgi:chalcone isomerase-like protein